MKKLKLIIIDNDVDERKFMESGFLSTGLFEILTIIDNGEKLMSFLQASPSNIPDLIISDLNMPGRSGFDILKDLRSSEEFSHVMMVIISTALVPSIVEAGEPLGARFKEKPESFLEYDVFAKDLYEEIQRSK